jgi:hypothetical protein
MNTSFLFIKQGDAKSSYPFISFDARNPIRVLWMPRAARNCVLKLNV